MEIKLSQPFAPNSAAAPFDVLQVKKGLNRLGYYTPLATTGITDIPDTAIFSALKKFQKDLGLAVTGIMNPDDATLRLLNLEISKTPKGHYIWRTVGDDRVRPSHAVLDNTIRSWNESLNPSQDFGCRCWAEHIADKSSKNIADNKKWSDLDFTLHYYFGMGVTINLESTGVLEDVIKRSKELIVPRIENQISKTLINMESGKFQYKTENSYDFQKISFSLGNTTIKTTTNGFIEREKRDINVNGTITFQLTDEFTDPLSLREIKKKTSAINQIDSKNKWTELGGAPYLITGKWELPLTITIKKAD